MGASTSKAAGTRRIITFIEAHVEAVGLTKELRAAREQDVMALAAVMKRARSNSQAVVTDQESALRDDVVEIGISIPLPTAQATIPWNIAFDEAKSAANYFATAQAEHRAAFDRIRQRLDVEQSGSTRMISAPCMRA